MTNTLPALDSIGFPLCVIIAAATTAAIAFAVAVRTDE